MTLFHGYGPFSASGIATGDLDFITSASGTTAASISVENCFSAGYSHYLVLRNYLGSVDDEYSNVRLRVSGTDTSAANYRRQRLTANSTTVDGARGTAETEWSQAMGYHYNTSFGFSRLWICNPFEAVRTTAWVDFGGTMTGNIRLQSMVFEHDLTTSYTSFSVLPASGTITGTIYVYGLAV